MTTIQTFLSGLAISVTLSLLIVFYLNKPLTGVLIDICGTQTRAKFWTHITNLSFVLVSLLMPILSRPREDLVTIFQLSRQLGWTLLGLIVTVIFVSMSISRFIRRVDSIGQPLPSGSSAGKK
jgi:uncharacterized membrane protein